MQLVQEQDILYMNYLKEEYGNQLQAAMIAGIQANQINANTAQQTAVRTLMEGLIMERHPEFYKEYAERGGDVEYLKYAVECFKQVRAMMVHRR